MDNFSTLGKVMWLWSHSALHRRWPIESAIHYIIPAIEKAQCRLLVNEEGMPIGYASWAWLSAEAEKRYILDPNSLRYQDWQSGERLWFIDFIAPFSFRDTIKLRRLMGKIHGNSYLARSIRLRKNNKAEVFEHMGGSVDVNESRRMKEAFYQEIKAAFIEENS